MKARHIKELRKVIANFKEYEVSYSSGLFGDFGVKAGECCKKITARNSQEAVERYLKWYFRKYKCRNRHHTNNLTETSRWGNFHGERKRVAKAFLNKDDAEIFAKSLKDAKNLLQYTEFINIKVEEQTC